MKIPFVKQTFYSFPVLFCFLLPFGGMLLSAIVIFWVLFSLFNLNRISIQAGLKNKQLLLFWLFFLVTCISAFFSKNQTEALSSVEIKMSFLIFPWLLFCYQYPSQVLKRCLIATVSGCFFACLILLVRAGIYAAKGQPEYFFYTLFSDFIHASYFSMYLIFSISVIVLFYHKWFTEQKEVKYMAYFFIVLFTLCIFLCSSKLGIISYFICMPLLFLYRNKQFIKVRYILILLISLGLILYLASNLFPDSFNRLQSIRTLDISKIDKASKESTTVRVLIWQQAFDLIALKPVFGFGVGDANGKLYEAYESNGLTGALQYRLNAHNQFLQTLLGLGLVGFVFLIYFTWMQFIIAIRKKSALLFVFAFLICLNFLVESMLQTAAGVLFFAFFYCFTHLISDIELLNA